MTKRRDVTIEVPTATAEGKGFPPKIITFKNFTRWNWKYLVITWALIVAIAWSGCLLPWPLSLIYSTVLSIAPFFFGTYAVTRRTIKEITG
jgi:hypothetical protein